MKQQQGFTLVELVIVIVILGILAAVAVPKFVDLSGDAETSAIKAVANSLSSASALNAAGCTLSGQAKRDNKCVQIAKCSDAGNLLTPAMTLGTDASATAYYLKEDTDATTNGESVTCMLQKDLGETEANWTAKFTVIGAAN
ncbi:type II secretion system GspH family protein [Thauera aromatica]|nr:type II secretion system protein [Thauera aromatica]MCK2125206.1 type II secretion system GspH family protein [Thauera aromatica]